MAFRFKTLTIGVANNMSGCALAASYGAALDVIGQ
jgi:hypothetical protein